MDTIPSSGFIKFVIILISITVITALVFGGWVMTRVFNAIRTLLGFGAPRGYRRPSGAVQYEPLPSRMRPNPTERICGYELCHAPNRPDARYCRRCGRPLTAHYVETRRAG